MSAQLKTMIDRSCPHHLDADGKDFYRPVAAFDPDPERLRPVIAAVRGFSTDRAELM